MKFQRCHVLISGTWKYVTFHRKQYVAHVIKLGIIRWRDSAGLSGGPSVITKAVKQESRGSESETEVM